MHSFIDEDNCGAPPQRLGSVVIISGDKGHVLAGHALNSAACEITEPSGSSVGVI